MRNKVLVASLVFVLLVFWIKSANVLPLDLLISKKVQSINFSGFSHLMTLLSNSGWGIKLVAWVVCVIAGLAILKKWLEALFIIILSALDGILFFGLSRLINRPRPTPDLIHVDFALNVGGFPSGHVLMITLVFGFLIYLAYTQVKRLWIKVVLITIFTLIILLMGVARIYSGQHWPTDVFGAYLLSGIILTIVIRFYESVRGRDLSSFLKQPHRFQENP